jgi:hypothetical protein
VPTQATRTMRPTEANVVPEQASTSDDGGGQEEDELDDKMRRCPHLFMVEPRPSRMFGYQWAEGYVSPFVASDDVTVARLLAKVHHRSSAATPLCANSIRFVTSLTGLTQRRAAEGYKTNTPSVQGFTRMNEEPHEEAVEGTRQRRRLRARCRLYPTPLASPSRVHWEQESCSPISYACGPGGGWDEQVRPSASDVVYDLGCGQGPFLIEAARVYGCRGLGVDLDEGTYDTGAFATPTPTPLPSSTTPPPPSSPLLKGVLTACLPSAVSRRTYDTQRCWSRRERRRRRRG